MLTATALPSVAMPWFSVAGGMNIHVVDAKRIKKQTQLEIQLWSPDDAKLLGMGVVTPIRPATMTKLLAVASEHGVVEKVHEEILNLTISATQILADIELADLGKDLVNGEVEYTDLGNASRFVAHAAGDVKYCIFRAEKGIWRLWTGKNWTESPMGLLHDMAGDMTRGLIEKSNTIEDPKQSAKLYAHALKSQSKKALDSMIALSQGALGCRYADFDKHKWLLNCDNGTLDLKTGILREHRREDLFSEVLETAYVPDAPCPKFLAFLEKFQPDAGVRSYLQKAIGYTLTGSNELEAVFFNHGVGANGKSTFINTFKAILGPMAVQGRVESFMIKDNGGGINNDIAGFAGKRMIACTELDQGKRLSETLLKQIAGTDTIRARFLHKEEFDYIATYKVWFGGNHKPTVRGADDGIWRRIHLIPWNVQIPVEEQTGDYWEKLVTEEAEGILAWAVRGCLEWQQIGGKLVMPDAVRGAVAEYRQEQDSIGTFVKECLVSTPGVRVSVKDVYAAYTVWCKENSEFCHNKRAVGRFLGDRGMKSIHTYLGDLWEHWALAPGVSSHATFAPSSKEVGF